MFCRRARNWIGLALDGALPPDRTMALTRHLEGCAACREYRQDLLHGRRLLAASAPALSDGFEWRLQLRLNRTLQEAARAASTPWEPVHSGAAVWIRGAGLAAAGGLALAAAIGFFVLPDGPAYPTRPAPQAPVVAMTPPLSSAPREAAPPDPQRASEPATVISTAGDPTRTAVSGRLGAPLLSREGAGHAVDLQLPGAPGARNMFERQGWSGGSLEDLRSIATLREQNRRLRDALAQAQRDVVLLRAQLDTAGGAQAGER